MELKEIWIIGTLLIASLIVFVSPFAVFLKRRIWKKVSCAIRKESRTSEDKSKIKGTFLFYVCLILAVWILRYAVGYYSLSFPEKGETALTCCEEVFNSFVHALQTFSMDEDYTEYITKGREMLCQMLGDDTVWQYVYGIYASLLNFIAPIAGGAIVFELLAGIFPSIKLWFSCHEFWRKKYYFSKLNEASLALAKNIGSKEKDDNPVFIFTDTNAEGENEKEYELIREAKQYGAICVHDDLAHAKKPKYGKREYHLTDENEFGNLQNLTALSEDRNLRFIKNSEIYLFVQSDAYIQIEKQVSKKIKERIIDEERPAIVPVKCYRNAVNNLLSEVPLYEPLVHKKNPESLSVTILGNGVIGTEAFLSIYWFGQMLISKVVNGNSNMSECALTVNVVSQDTEDAFWSKINYVNPEIRQTVEILEGDTQNDEGRLLVYNARGDKNKPYCKVRYTQSDVKTGDFWDDSSEEKKRILASDYFIVALGNDADNISVAEKLRLCIGKKHIAEACNSDEHKTVIAYAVFDSKLSSALNKQKFFSSKSYGTCDIYMYAFADLEQVYSCDNIYMSKNMLWATQTGNAYLNSFHNNSHGEDNKKRIGKKADDYENANYNYWANLARAMHVKYKVFSLGWIKTSVFDCLTEEDYEAHRKNVNEQCEMYRLFATSYKPSVFIGEYKAKYEEIELKKHCLAWLEHRRWCAFTRTMGYQYIDIQNILEQSGSHKDMRLKLHACLAEARMPQIHGDNTYITAQFDDSGKVDISTVLGDGNTENLDCLDMASYAKKTGDFKEYDYYRYELDGFEFENEVLEELKSLGIPEAERCCSHTLFDEAVCCETAVGSVYLISIDSVKWALGKKYKTVSDDEKVKVAFTFRGTAYATRLNVILAAAKSFFDKSKKE